MALIDHRDAAEAGLRVLTDPALWGAHHDLTAPVSMRGRRRSSCFRRNSASRRFPGRGRAAVPRAPDRRLGTIPAGEAELLIAREWAILAGQRTTTRPTRPTDHRPPPAPGGRVPSRAPRRFRLKMRSRVLSSDFSPGAWCRQSRQHPGDGSWGYVRGNPGVARGGLKHQVKNEQPRHIDPGKQGGKRDPPARRIALQPPW